MSLKEGQYQIGDFVFGVGTQAVISSFEQTGYTITPGDYALPQSDEVRFRKDFLQPATILMTVSAMDNYILDNFWEESSAPPEFPKGSEIMEQFMKEWRADEIRKIWGYTKPLRYKRLGQLRRVYGRPRDIATPPRRMGPGWYDMVCAYQRADTFSYSDVEYGALNLLPTTLGTPGGTVVRQDGEAPTWVNIFITGPIANPKVTLGSFTIDMTGYTLAAGELVQITSYPWERRAVSSNGNNISPKLVGASPYLDKLVLPAGVSWNTGLHGTGTNGNTRLNVIWREAYHSL